MKCIDVSVWQGDIDWKKVKASGIDYAIIRCSYGTNGLDKKFKQNIEGAKAAGIKVGVYHYSYSKTVGDAQAEAKHVLNVINGYKLDLPIFFDVEERDGYSNVKTRCIAFGEIIEAAGLWCGVYSSASWFNGNLNGLALFTKWIASWVKNDGKQYTKPDCDVWQYCSVGKVSGINGNVDMNEMYRDYHEISGVVRDVSEVKTSKKETKTKKTDKDISEAAIAVWQGVYGNGDERVKKLKEAGFTIAQIKKIQTLVNQTNSNKVSNTYTIQAGDTLTSIAKKFSTSIDSLVALNNIKDKNKIYAGQVIKIVGMD